MRSKRLNISLLGISVLLDAAILFYLSDAGLRLALGLLLLVPIVFMASRLEVTDLFGEEPAIQDRPRRFPLLRTNVVALLDEVRRLNWLAVDLDRGFRERSTVAADIEMTERRLQELLNEIQRTAGQSAAGFDEGAETHPGDAPAMPVGEPPEGTEEG